MTVDPRERRNMDIQWGFFGPIHILTLILAVAMVWGLYKILKNKSRTFQTLVLGLLSLSGIAAIIFNLVTWDSPWEYLPLHLCSINAILLPIAVFRRSKTIGNMLLLWSLGSLAAIVVNNAQADFEIFSSTFFFYYFPHVLEFGIPILLIRLGLIEKDARCIFSTLGLTVLIYTLVHLCNLTLNALDLENQAGMDIAVNYMYSMVPENPVMMLCWKILPRRYWYLFLLFPMIALYLLAVYAPQILLTIRHRNRVSKAVG